MLVAAVLFGALLGGVAGVMGGVVLLAIFGTGAILEELAFLVPGVLIGMLVGGWTSFFIGSKSEQRQDRKELSVWEDREDKERWEKIVRRLQSTESGNDHEHQETEPPEQS